MFKNENKLRNNLAKMDDNTQKDLILKKSLLKDKVKHMMEMILDL